MKEILIGTFLMLATCTWAQEHYTQRQTDSLLVAIDKALELAPAYADKKEQLINRLKRQREKAGNDNERYLTDGKLWEVYASYQNDSAIVYAEEARTLAETSGRKDWTTESYIRLGSQYAKAGYYVEAGEYFQMAEQTMPTGDRKLHEAYLAACSQFYGDIAAASKDRHLRNRYFHRVDSLRNIILHEADPHSSLFLRKQVVRLQNEKRYREAMEYCNQWRNHAKEGTADYALMAFHRAGLHRQLGDSVAYKYWLGLSALTDIRLATMDQASLWKLAELLSREGDLKRAHRYIESSWNFNTQFGARTRSWQVSPVLSAINGTYKQRLVKSNRSLMAAVIAVAALLLVMLAVLVYVVRKRRQLAVLNRLLTKLNGELSALNGQLSETNQIKDEYIGKFLSLCAGYVDKLDNYRIKVNRKLKANQTEQLLRMTSSEQLKHDELKELFDHFDAVFLHLFPTFVEDFNALLRPDARMVPPGENRLTTDLRIFALIRLGIDESSRIAEFLHYSPNSIYSYRARIKNKAAGNRDDFERRVKSIGVRN